MTFENYEYEAVAERFPPVRADRKALLEDMLRAMPCSKVDVLMGWPQGTVRGAIERGEMRYLRARNFECKGKGSKKGQRLKVTPFFVAEWIEGYCVCKEPALAGEAE